VERLRTVTISYEIDTNKRTVKEALTLGEHDENEDIKELLERVAESIDESITL
jgi:hypothetical protein